MYWDTNTPPAHFRGNPLVKIQNENNIAQPKKINYFASRLNFRSFLPFNILVCFGLMIAYIVLFSALLSRLTALGCDST